eukprot:365135-Chlamydomonas_euryale.AAC.6
MIVQSMNHRDAPQRTVDAGNRPGRRDVPRPMEMCAHRCAFRQRGGAGGDGRGRSLQNSRRQRRGLRPSWESQSLVDARRCGCFAPEHTGEARSTDGEKLGGGRSRLDVPTGAWNGRSRRTRRARCNDDTVQGRVNLTRRRGRARPHRRRRRVGRHPATWPAAWPPPARVATAWRCCTATGGLGTADGGAVWSPHSPSWLWPRGTPRWPPRHVAMPRCCELRQSSGPAPSRPSTRRARGEVAWAVVSSFYRLFPIRHRRDGPQRPDSARGQRTAARAVPRCRPALARATESAPSRFAPSLTRHHIPAPHANDRLRGSCPAPLRQQHDRRASNRALAALPRLGLGIRRRHSRQRLPPGRLVGCQRPRGCGCLPPPNGD